MEQETKILTPQQKEFLDLVSEEKYLCKKFYLTGGTPLATFYLYHRISEDIDLFSEEEINLLPIRAFLGKVQKKLKLGKIDYRNFLGLHSFELYFSEKEKLKVDFNYYPFPRIEKGIKYKNISVDGIYDIAVNKVHTIALNPRARDFIDIYFIIKEKNYSFEDLIMKAKAKFDWHIDFIQIGVSFTQAAELKDYPRMIKKIDPKEWKQFFIDYAISLRKQIFN